MRLFSEPDKMTRCQDAQILASSFKVIPLKKKSSNIKFNSFKCFLPDVCFKKCNKQDRLLTACLGDIMGQTYPIYACTGTYHMHHFIIKVHFAAANGSKSF